MFENMKFIAQYNNILIIIPQTVLATVGVLADLLEGRWSQVTSASPGLVLKT